MKYFTGGKIERVIIVSLTPGDLFLESIEELIKEENIETAVITSGIGSFRKFKYHTITWIWNSIDSGVNFFRNG